MGISIRFFITIWVRGGCGLYPTLTGTSTGLSVPALCRQVVYLLYKTLSATGAASFVCRGFCLPCRPSVTLRSGLRPAKTGCLFCVTGMGFVFMAAIYVFNNMQCPAATGASGPEPAGPAFVLDLSGSGNMA